MYRLTTTTTVWSAFLLLAGCGSDSDDSQDDTRELQQGLDALAVAEVEDPQALGIGFIVELPDGRVFESEAGTTSPDTTDPYSVSDTKQVIGSVTKLFTATMVLQLIEEEKLSLSDTLKAWVDIPAADEITVEMLLQHTSGLADYLPVMTSEQRGQSWTPQELVDLAVDAGARAQPGTEMSIYSNTNFVLLAMIVEDVTGASWEANLQSRVAQPLELSHTFYAGSTSGASGLSSGWVYTDGGWVDALTVVDASTGWGMGAVTSTVRELSIFNHALFSGSLFVEDVTLESMKTFTHTYDPDTQGPGEPPTQVGLAMERYKLPGGVVLDGHYGHALGYWAGVFREPTTGALISVASTSEHLVVPLTAGKIAQYLNAR